MSPSLEMASEAAGSETERAEAIAAATPVVLVAIDESDHSYYALQWTLDRFFADPGRRSAVFSLIIVHAKPTPASVIGLAGPGAADVLPFVDSDLRKIAAGVVEKAKQLCRSRSADNVLIEVVEGDARNVICEAVDKHRATMLIMGSHGYGAIKRAFLGSVSDHCVHHAHCSVMIIKKPKH
ncbi:adenine nucleotide alpha hydrolases-like superfamily protein [Wolffia australiana]